MNPHHLNDTCPADRQLDLMRMRQAELEDAREHRKQLAALILGGLAVVALVVCGVV